MLGIHCYGVCQEAKAMEEMKALKATMRKLVEEADYLYKPYNLQGFMHHLGYMTFQGASFPE